MERSSRKGSNVTPPVPSCIPISPPLMATCPHGPHTPVARPFYIIESPVWMTTGGDQGKPGSAQWWMGYYRPHMGSRQTAQGYVLPQTEGAGASSMGAYHNLAHHPLQ